MSPSPALGKHGRLPPSGGAANRRRSGRLARRGQAARERHGPGPSGLSHSPSRAPSRAAPKGSWPASTALPSCASRSGLSISERHACGDQQVCADLGEETSRAMKAVPRVVPVISGLPVHAVNEKQALRPDGRPVRRRRRAELRKWRQSQRDSNERRPRGARTIDCASGG